MVLSQHPLATAFLSPVMDDCPISICPSNGGEAWLNKSRLLLPPAGQLKVNLHLGQGATTSQLQQAATHAQLGSTAQAAAVADSMLGLEQ